MLAVLLPLTGYFILKRATDKATVMPRHFIPDSVITVTKNGKQYNDTVWHQLPEIHLTNQLGDTVTWKDLEGKIVVADFFFTHCPLAVPLNATSVIGRLSFSVKSKGSVPTSIWPDETSIWVASATPPLFSTAILKFPCCKGWGKLLEA